MDEITKTCKKVIDSLKLFSEEILTLGASINDNRVEVFEEEIGLILPIDFKYIIREINGFSLMGTEVFGMNKMSKGNSLELVYAFEHFEVANPMPKFFLPFSPDGLGNYYCLNLEKINKGVAPIMFWQHDYNYKDVSDVEETHDNFTDWVNEVVISWTLEDYDYNGDEK